MQVRMVPESRPTATSSKRANNTVANLLRERIRSGHYQVGEWLPTERMLTEDLRVHRRVVRDALTQLENEGLILRRPHCRPIVQALERQAPVSPPIPTVPTFPTSRFVALVMYHGGDPEQGTSAQQRIFWGMNEALGMAGYHAVFLDLGDRVRTEVENAEREAAHLRYVLDHGFGGVVFYSYAYLANKDLIREVSRRVPFVLLDRTLPGVEADFVGAANHQAMYDATKHLIEQGHRRIAYVTKAERINTVQDRLQGYVNAIHDLIPDDVYDMVITTPWMGSSKWPSLDAVFRLPKEERPTAVLCVNDYTAALVAERLAHLGISVPDDVSLIGFDNIVHQLPGGVGLTTVAQPFEDIGRTAAELVIRRFEKPSLPLADIQLPTQLVVRESSREISS